LERLHEHMAGVEDDRVIKGVQLSRSITEISDALVDLNILPIQDIPSQLRSANDVLAAMGGACLWRQLSSLTLSLFEATIASGHSACCFSHSPFFLFHYWHVCNIYIYFYIF
jgi:hypothetical protein